MASLSAALDAATSDLGSPCESSGEMSCSFRRRPTNPEQGRRVTLPMTAGQESGFRSSIDESLLTRDVAIAGMRRLTLTPLEPVLSPTTAYADVDSFLALEPVHCRRRNRARTMPDLGLESSRKERKGSCKPFLPDVDPVFGHWRNEEDYSTDYDSDDCTCDREDELGEDLRSTLQPSAHEDSASSAPMSPTCRSPRSGSSSSSSNVTILHNPVPISKSSRRGSIRGSLRTSAQDVDKRRDSGRPCLDQGPSRRRINGTCYYMYDDFINDADRSRAAALSPMGDSDWFLHRSERWLTDG